MKRVISIVLAAALLTCLFAGCGRQDGGKDKKRVLGVTFSTLNNDFFVALNNGIQAAADAAGDKLIVLDPQYDQAKQISQVEDMIAQGVDLVFLNPVDWQGVKPALDACEKAKIPVVVIDTPVYDEDMVNSTVASDNYLAGQLVAQDLMKRTDGGNIVVLNMPVDKSARDRYSGFSDTIKENTAFTIIAEQDGKGTLEDSLKVMENIIQAHPDEIDVVFAINDPSAQGAFAALEAAGKTDSGILLYGVDGSPDVKGMIKAGQITGTAAQFPAEIGSVAYEKACDILAGKDVDKSIAVKVEMITADTLDEYSIDAWD